jgi:glycosyltransferase involved in cell wall biosynthesis
VKGPHLLLEAFLAAFAGTEVHLALVGAGPLDGQLALRANGRAQIHLCGEHLDGPSLLPAFDVYAQTSLSEGRSLAMLEAMAAGLPTVAHDLPGVREFHGDATAILVPLRDSAALQEALRALAGSPSRRRQMGEAARRASVGFSFDDTVNAYADLYRLLASGHAELAEARA